MSTKPKTEKQRILAWLKSGKRLTPILALRHFGCMSLSQRIGELIRDGHDIVRDRREVKPGTRVGLYYMMKGGKA